MKYNDESWLCIAILITAHTAFVIMIMAMSYYIGYSTCLKQNPCIIQGQIEVH